MKIVNSAIMAVSLMAAAPAMAGDVGAGENKYNNSGCSGCHGAAGNSQIPSFPKLSGKDADVIAKALADFKSGARKDPTMNAMATGLSDADITNIAAYLSAQK